MSSTNHNRPGATTKKSRRKGKSNSLGIDLLDTKIIRELLAKPDIGSLELAKKLGKPLSTILRRKNDLENSRILRSNYELSVQALGWRNAEILMLIEKGKTDYMAQELIEKFDKVIGTSIRINTEFNLAAYVGYRDSNELHELMEKIRAIPSVNHLQWSEVVREIGNKNHRLAHLIFNSSK